MKKPITPIKPKEPPEFIFKIITAEITMDDYISWIDLKNQLSDFCCNNSLEESEVSINISTDEYYSSVYFHGKKNEANPRYEKEIFNYNKRLEKYNERHLKYIEDLKEYNISLKEKQEKSKDNEIKSLKLKLDKIKSKLSKLENKNEKTKKSLSNKTSI